MYFNRTNIKFIKISSNEHNLELRQLRDEVRELRIANSNSHTLVMEHRQEIVRLQSVVLSLRARLKQDSYSPPSIKNQMQLPSPFGHDLSLPFTPVMHDSSHSDNIGKQHSSSSSPNYSKSNVIRYCSPIESDLSSSSLSDKDINHVDNENKPCRNVENSSPQISGLRGKSSLGVPIPLLPGTGLLKMLSPTRVFSNSHAEYGRFHPADRSIKHGDRDPPSGYRSSLSPNFMFSPVRESKEREDQTMAWIMRSASKTAPIGSSAPKNQVVKKEKSYRHKEWVKSHLRRLKTVGDRPRVSFQM